MKTSALIIAALFAGTTFAATSAMAQPGGVGGNVNLKTAVSANGKIKAGKKSILHLGNSQLKNSRIGGNYTGQLLSKVGGDVILKKGAHLEHGSVYLNGSQVTGNLDVTASAQSDRIELGKNAKYYQSSLVMDNSKVNGSLTFNSRSKTGRVTLGKNGYGNIASLRMNGSTINGGNVDLNAQTGNVRIDKDGKAYIAALDLTNTTITGAANFKSTVKVGDVHVKKGGTLKLSSLVLNGGAYGGFDLETNVILNQPITVEKDSEVEIGAVEM